MHSHRLGPDFWFELGAHTCYSSYAELLSLMRSTGSLQPIARRKLPYRLWTGGTLRPVMAELGLASIWWRLPRLLTTRKAGRSVQDYYTRLVGRRNYEHLFRPLFAAVPCQNADAFPADMLFKRRHRVKGVPRSFTVAGGLQGVVAALTARSGVTVMAGSEVTALGPARGGAHRVRTAGAELEAQHVVLAVPPPVAARVVGEVAPELAAALARVKVMRVESVAVVLRRERVAVEPVAGIVSLDGGFFSVVARDPIPHASHRAFTFHLPPQTGPDQALALITSVLGVSARDIEHKVTSHAVLPSPELGHRELVGIIDRAAAKSGLFVTGNYFGGLAIEDCVLRSAAELRRLVGQ